MKKVFALLISILVVAMFSVSLTGCASLFKGEAGTNGTNLSILKQTGVLYTADLTVPTSGLSYWDTYDFDITSSSIVSVWVRQGAGFVWIEPSWYRGATDYVRIFDDSTVSAGYEYMILVADSSISTSSVSSMSKEEMLRIATSGENKNIEQK